MKYGIGRLTGIVLVSGMACTASAAARVCRCADTGVCVLPAGECDSVGRPVVAPLARKIALRHKVIRQDAWYGGRRTVFDFEGYEAWIVEPPEGVTPPFERPWTWTMQWRTAFVPRTGVPELLKRGFHHVTIDTFRHRMDEKGLAVSKAFQEYLTDELGLSPKAKLIGLSWGGFFSVRYAAAYPELVDRIVLDNALLDFGTKFRSGIGPWTDRQPAAGWSGCPEMPVNKAEALAKADIPVLQYCAAADTVTPPAENARVFDARVRKAGGRIRTVERPCHGHHPHGVEAGDTGLVEFMTEELDPEPEPVTRRIALLENGDLSEHWYTWFQSARMRHVDRRNVMTAEGSVLKVSGADMGCVTTKKAFRDYRLTVEFRYADTDVQLNKTDARDGGILFHSTGADGVYGPGIWMPSFEYNVFQGATADLIVVGDGERNPGRYRAAGCVDEAALAKGRRIWSPNGREIRLVDKGRIDSPVSSTGYQPKDCATGPYEKPVGEWNKAVVVCRGDEAEFYLNEKLLGHYYGLRPSGGRIQLQSEGFGIEYRNIVLEPLTADEAAGKDVPRPECRLRAGTAEIVIAPGAHAAEKLAASEMSDLLGQALGAPVPVVNRPSPGWTSVFLGSNEWTRAAGIRTESLARDAFTMRCDGRNVYIAGRDGTTDDPARHCFLGDEARWQLQFERATLFGVYAFLERYAGVRMYFPGELGTVVPKADEIRVPRLDVTVVPDYTVRRWGYADGKVPAGLLAGGLSETAFKLRNFYRLRGETAYVPCCHGQRKFGYVQRFRKTRPEYFAMAEDGTRMAAAIKDPLHDGQFCQSSGIWDEMYFDISSYLRGEPASVRGVLDENGVPGWGRCVFGRFVDVMPQDGMVACHCPKCQAAYRKGDIDYATELVWGQTVRLANRLKADGLDCTLVLEAYLPYGRMPEMAIPDNVNVQVSRAGPWSVCTPSTLRRHNREIAAWAEKVGRKVWLWTYTCKVDCFNVGMPDVPQMTPRVWGAYYKSLRESIVGAFSESESDRWLYNYLNYYVFSKVCWDTRTDVDALLDEHYRLMYGAGAPFVKRFFEALEHKWIREIEVDMKDSPIGPAVAYAPKEKEVWTTVYPPAVLATYAAWLDAAEKAVSPGSLEARRLALVRSEFLAPMQERSARYAAK